MQDEDATAMATKGKRRDKAPEPRTPADHLAAARRLARATHLPPRRPVGTSAAAVTEKVLWVVAGFLAVALALPFPISMAGSATPADVWVPGVALVVGLLAALVGAGLARRRAKLQEQRATAEVREVERRVPAEVLAWQERAWLAAVVHQPWMDPATARGIEDHLARTASVPTPVPQPPLVPLHDPWAPRRPGAVARTANVVGNTGVVMAIIGLVLMAPALRTTVAHEEAVDLDRTLRTGDTLPGTVVGFEEREEGTKNKLHTYTCPVVEYRVADRSTTFVEPYDCGLVAYRNSRDLPYGTGSEVTVRVSGSSAVIDSDFAREKANETIVDGTPGLALLVMSLFLPVGLFLVALGDGVLWRRSEDPGN